MTIVYREEEYNISGFTPTSVMTGDLKYNISLKVDCVSKHIAHHLEGLLDNAKVNHGNVTLTCPSCAFDITLPPIYLGETYRLKKEICVGPHRITIGVDDAK